MGELLLYQRIQRKDSLQKEEWPPVDTGCPQVFSPVSRTLCRVVKIHQPGSQDGVKLFSNAVSNAAPGPHGTKCESAQVLQWPKVHCKCPAPSPLAWKAYSKPSLLLLAVSICLWGGKFINHSLQWKISCLTQDGCNRIRGWHPPRRCKTGDRNVSLSQQGY